MTTVSSVSELAAALAGSAPTITLRGGTYRGGSGTHAFTITRPVALVAYPGETPVLTYTPEAPPAAGGGNVGGILAVRAAGVTLDGLTIVGTRELGSAAAQTDINIVLGEEAADFTLRRCTLRQAAHAGLKAGARGGFLLVEACTFEDAGYTQQDHHIYISDDGGRVTVRNSVFTSQHGGYAVHLYNPDNDLPAGCRIYGNVVFGNAYGVLLGGNDHALHHNTICDNANVGVQLWKGSAGLDVRNNILRGNGTYDLSPDTVSILGAHNFGANNIGSIRVAEWAGARALNVAAQFVAADPQNWQDYALAAGSPMRGAAQPVSGVTLLDPGADTPTATTLSGRNLGAFGEIGIGRAGVNAGGAQLLATVRR